MKSFLEDIAQQYAGLGPDLEHYCFILPSKRAGNFLRTYLKESMTKTVFAPKVTSIETFVGELANLAYLSEEQQLFELYSIYKAQNPDPLESFADFSSWAATLLIDFSEIDQYLVDAQKLFSYLEEYKKLSEWNPTDEPNELLSSYVTFWKSLYPMYEALSKNLLEQQLGTRGMIYKRAAEQATSYLDQHPKTKFVFVGFNALNKAEEQIIQGFLAKGRARIHWDIDSYVLNDEFHDAGHFIRTYKAHWKALQEEALEGVSHYLGGQKSIELIGLPMHVSQAQYTGELLNQMPREDLKNTALVLGVEESLNLVLNALPKSIFPNITMGYALANAKATSFVRLMFELHKSSGSFRATDCYKLLLHPLAKELFKLSYHSSIDQLVFEMRSQNLSYWKRSDLESIQPKAKDFFELLFAKELGEPKGFIQHLKQWLDQLKQAARTQKDPALETDALFIESLFDKLVVWVNSYEFINSLQALEQLFERMLSKTQNYFKGEAMEGLQIMGMLESRNLDFETVMLTHLNEGILPGGKKQNSHLPYQLKKMYGLPTYKERDAIFTYHFYRLLQRCKKAYLIYNIEPEVLEGGEPSRFITQLETDRVLKKYVTNKIISPSLSTLPKAPLSIQKSAEDIVIIREKLARSTSPSLLTTYLWNPIDFYHKYVLKIKEQPEFDAQIPHNIFGSIVHDSLEELYKPLIGKVLTPAQLQLLYPQVKSVVNHFYETYFVSLDNNSGKNIIAYEVIVNYIKTYIRSDVEASKKQELKLIGLEEQFEMPLEFPSLDLSLNCIGTFDRVEERNGVLTIIDYKTGKVDKSQLKMNNWDTLIEDYKYSKQFQLLFYSMMYMNRYQLEELQAGIVSFKNLKEGLMLFTEAKSTRITMDTISQFKEQLEALVAQIIDPGLPFVEEKREKN